MPSQKRPTSLDVHRFGRMIEVLGGAFGSGTPKVSGAISIDGHLWAMKKIDAESAKLLWQAGEFNNEISSVHDLQASPDRITLLVMAYKFAKSLKRVWGIAMVLLVGDKQTPIGFFSVKRFAEIPAKIRGALSGKQGWAGDMATAVGAMA